MNYCITIKKNKKKPWNLYTKRKCMEKYIMINNI